MRLPCWRWRLRLQGADESITGNDVYAGCRMLSRREFAKDVTDAINWGYRAGVATAITATHPKVCPPDGATTGTRGRRRGAVYG
jgi:hypothetical protein